MRALKYRLLDEVVIVPPARHRAGLVVNLDIDGALERLVHAMLAPGLGQRLQLDVRWLAPALAEIVLNGLHLRQGEKQMPVAAQPRQLLIVQFAQRDVLEDRNW